MQSPLIKVGHMWSIIALMVSCLVVAVLHVAKKTRMGMIVSIAADTSVDCNLYTCIPFDGISFYMPVCQLWHLIVSLLMT